MCEMRRDDTYLNTGKPYDTINLTRIDDVLGDAIRYER